MSTRATRGPSIPWIVLCFAIAVPFGELVALVVLVAVLRRSGLRFHDFVPSAPTREQVIEAAWLGGLSFALSFGAVWLIYSPLLWLAPESVSRWLLKELTYHGGPPWQVPLVILRYVLIGPVHAELIFRGLLLPRAVSKLGMTRGVALLSAIYAVLHLDVLGALIFAVVAAVLFLSTGNLAVSFVAHATCNLGVCLVGSRYALWVGPAPGNGQIAMFNPDFVPAALLLFAVSSTLIARWTLSQGKELERRFAPSCPSTTT